MHTRLKKSFEDVTYYIKVKVCIINIICIGLLIAATTSCTSSDCPLNNTARLVCGFYNPANDSSLTLGDTITVVARDSVILNRATNEATISLPMSYDGAADTLVFHFTPSGSKASISDTLIVSKTNEPHVISLECGTSIFHTITNATCTSRTPNSTFRYAISRVAVSQPNVNFDGQENLKIYLAVHQ